MTIFYNILLLIATWVISKQFLKTDLYYVWFKPFHLRGKQFLSGFLLMIVLCIISQLILAYAIGGTYTFNRQWINSKFLSSIFYDLNSVLFEELLFRGLIFFVLLKFLSSTKAILISASAFGIYHWFTGGVLGNIPAMVLVFIVTGSMGYVFAKAYSITRSLILPFALHLGWNITNHTLFSNGPFGEIILYKSQGAMESTWTQFFAFLIYLIVSLIAFLSVKYIITSDNQRDSNYPQVH